jgi:hypothetical protein
MRRLQDGQWRRWFPSSATRSTMTRLHNKSQWHRGAHRQMQKVPLCAMCLSEGKVVATRTVNHIEPHHNDPVKFWTGRLCAPIVTRAGRSS